MKTTDATRRRFDFLSPEDSDQYLIFLKEHVYSTDPMMLAIISHEIVQSDEGEMIEVIICDEIENPHHEIIALCVVNNAPIIVWNDKVYTIALHTAGRPAVWLHGAVTPAGLDWQDIIKLWGIGNSRQRMVIHEIVEPIFEDDRILESE